MRGGRGGGSHLQQDLRQWTVVAVVARPVQWGQAWRRRGSRRLRGEATTRCTMRSGRAPAVLPAAQGRASGGNSPSHEAALTLLARWVAGASFSSRLVSSKSPPAHASWSARSPPSLSMAPRGYSSHRLPPAISSTGWRQRAGRPGHAPGHGQPPRPCRPPFTPLTRHCGRCFRCRPHSAAMAPAPPAGPVEPWQRLTTTLSTARLAGLGSPAAVQAAAAAAAIMPTIRHVVIFKIIPRKVAAGGRPRGNCCRTRLPRRPSSCRSPQVAPSTVVGAPLT